MSIITEALKRAERDRERDHKHSEETAVAVISEELEQAKEMAQEAPLPVSEEEPPVVTAPEPAAPQQAPQPGFFVWQFSREQARDILILSGVIVICALVLVMLFQWPRPAPDASLGAPLTPSVSTTSRRTSGPALPFVLTGVSSTGTSRHGIVNGVVVQEGDTVDGAIVKSIGDHELTLETRAGEIKLKIQS